jgi:soluble lytic murein transglycosylase-like protein
LAVSLWLAILPALALPLDAAERITLKNGFDLVCDHRALVDGRIRLYTEPGSANFVEVDQAEISSVEIVPDAPPIAAAKQAAAPTAEKKDPALTSAALHELIAQAGAGHNLDVDLLASVVLAESGGNARAVSRTGAQGLMQLMPQTAARLGVTDSFRADQNIQGGTAYLDALLVQYHDNLALALAAYNAGPEAVEKYHGVPPYRETQNYVARVIREFNRRKRVEAQERAALTGRPGNARKAAQGTVAAAGAAE